MRALTSMIIASGLFLTGCESIDSRVREHAGAFESWPTATQERIRGGEVHIKDTKEMVYVAFGDPTKEESIITSGGRKRTVWTYSGEYHVRDGVRITSVASNVIGGVYAAGTADNFKTYEIVLCQVTFYDGEVIHLRNPAAETAVITESENTPEIIP